jgi:xanthine dehydrogenase accessory factor
MTIRASFPRPAAIVLGCGEVGSAVALALHRARFAVVLVDEADPAWHRRGMAFTNAWYVGNAELESEGACFCASLKSIPSILERRMIAATTWSWPGVAAGLNPALLVDARGRRRRGAEVLRGHVPVTIGIGAGFVDGENVDVALELGADDDGRSGGPRADSADAVDANPPFSVARSVTCTVEALRHGRFITERRIGEYVRVGQIVGGLGNEVIKAPGSGVLLGLAARGARIELGDTLVEVDGAGVAHRCYGVGAGPRQVASRLLCALGERQNQPATGTNGGGCQVIDCPQSEPPCAVAVLSMPRSTDGMSSGCNADPLRSFSDQSNGGSP